MAFSFLHAADLHLGSPLKGLALRDEAIAQRFASAGRAAFSELIDTALAEKVDFALIAGDIYDGEWKDTAIGHFFGREIARLTRAGIEVFLIKGNHDAESVVTRSLPLPEGVHVVSTDKAETRLNDRLGVAIHGRSFRDRVVTENLALGYPPASPGVFNIGMLHTSLAGNPQHETYAPCSLADLATRGYDYWALGHVHDFAVMADDPLVVFPGNLQGRSIRECGPKGAVIVDVAEGRVAGLRRIIVDKARFAEITVDLSGSTTDAEADLRIREALRPLPDLADGRMLATRIRLTGTTDLHGRWIARTAQKRDDIEALLAQALDDAWLEKLVIATRPTQTRPADGPASLLDVAGLFAGLEQDPELLEIGRQLVDDLATRWPATQDARIEDLAALLPELLAEAGTLVLARAASPAAGREPGA